MKKAELFNLLLGVVSAFYFGWLKGRNDMIIKSEPVEVNIDGRKILIPKNVYDTIKNIIT